MEKTLFSWWCGQYTTEGEQIYDQNRGVIAE